VLKWFLVRYFILFGGFLLTTSALAEEESSIMKVKMYKAPKRDVSVIITGEGYYPETISIFEGEEVKFFLTSTQDAPGCMIISEHDFYLSAHRGELTERSVQFRRPGHYDFYCPSLKHKGTITVLKKRKASRSIASKKKKKKPKHWMPKEY
jgi:plastocyanin